MPILTAEARRRLKDSDFALPGRRFPIHNIDHARVALSMAHTATPAEQKVIKSKVHAKYPQINSSWTQAEDDQYDKKHGIKEGSKADKIEDAKHGINDDDKLNKMMKGL